MPYFREILLRVSSVCGLRDGALLNGVALGLQQCPGLWHVAVVARRFRLAAVPKPPEPWAQVRLHLRLVS